MAKTPQPRRTRSVGRQAPNPPVLDAELPATPTNGLAEILKFVFHEFVDALARRVEVLPDFLSDLFARNPVPGIRAMVPRHTRAAPGQTRSGASCSPRGRDRPTPRGAATEEQRGARADRQAQERGGEQVILWLARLTRAAGVSTGDADARPRSARAVRRRRSHLRWIHCRRHSQYLHLHRRRRRYPDRRT